MDLVGLILIPAAVIQGDVDPYTFGVIEKALYAAALLLIAGATAAAYIAGRLLPPRHHRHHFVKSARQLTTISLCLAVPFVAYLVYAVSQGNESLG